LNYRIANNAPHNHRSRKVMEITFGIDELCQDTVPLLMQVFDSIFAELARRTRNKNGFQSENIH